MDHEVRPLLRLGSLANHSAGAPCMNMRPIRISPSHPALVVELLLGCPWPLFSNLHFLGCRSCRHFQPAAAAAGPSG